MIYFKVINHDTYINKEILKINQLQCDTFNGTTKSNLDFKNTDEIIINNVWYSLETLLLKSGLNNTQISELKSPKYIKAVYSYAFNTNPTYHLNYLDVYEIADKDSEPKNYKQNTGTYITEWSNSSNQQKGYGTYIYFNFGSTNLNDSEDHYFIIHSGSPTSNYSNNPLIKWNGVNGGMTNESRVYDKLNDISCATSNTSINIVFNEDYNNLSIYKNNSLLEKTNVKKNDNKIYMLNPNDVIEFKKSTEPEQPAVKYFELPKIEHVTFTPDKIPENTTTTVNVKVDSGYTIEKIHFWVVDTNTGDQLLNTSYKDGSIEFDLTDFDNDSIHLLTDHLKQSVVIKPNTIKPEPPKPVTPVYYTLPNVSHVTFNPKQAELGKMTPIAVNVENGYTINNLTFSATNPNTGLNIFTSSYNNGVINLDLTHFNQSEETNVDNLIEVTHDINQITYQDWLIPTATGITFTAGGEPITTIKLGGYKNIVLHLDEHYWWDDNQGKGLVLDDGTLLGSWNGKNIFGINLENYTDPEQLKTAHWQLNYRKVDFSDDHTQQIPLKLELTNCSCDTQSILENSSKTITLTADDGFIFDDDVIYSYYDIDGGYYNKLTKKANKKNTISFDMFVGPYHDYQNIKDDNQIPTIKAVAIKPDTIPTGTQSIHIYDMKDGEINTFMNSLVEHFGPDGVDVVDFTKYVNQIYRIPFNVPAELTTNISNINVGKYTIDVNTKQVNQDKLIIDGGNIVVKPHYNNANDYSPIECVLYLPFTKEVSLNINDIINHTINIKYNIDLLSGTTTIIVSNENNEIYTGQFNISTSLEYYGLYEDKLVNNLNSTYINDILQAYIKLIYNKPINNLVSYETLEHGNLKDYHGFTKIKNIDLQGNYNYNELVEINTLLKQGVFINDFTRD